MALSEALETDLTLFPVQSWLGTEVRHC